MTRRGFLLGGAAIIAGAAIPAANAVRDPSWIGIDWGAGDDRTALIQVEFQDELERAIADLFCVPTDRLGICGGTYAQGAEEMVETMLPTVNQWLGTLIPLAEEGRRLQERARDLEQRYGLRIGSLGVPRSC